jgi:uncharacterized protein (TIGR02266 family)
MKEKRLLRRERKRLKVRFGQELERLSGYTDDVSVGGFFIRSAVVYRPGSVITVEFLGSGDEAPIRLRAEVMWSKRVPRNALQVMKGGMGVRVLAFEKGERDFNELVRQAIVRRRGA